MSDYSDYYLSHYGVLGMKWGVRKARKEVKAGKKARKQAIKDAKGKEAKAAAKAELKKYKAGGRTKGQRFADFMLATPKDVRAYMEKGESHSKALLRSMGDNLVTGAAIGVAAKVGATLITAAVGTAVGVKGAKMVLGSMKNM